MLHAACGLARLIPTLCESYLENPLSIASVTSGCRKRLAKRSMSSNVRRLRDLS